jgi:hypothetical protein
MVPAQCLEGRNTDGCRPLRISSRSLSLCAKSVVLALWADEEGRTEQQKQILVKQYLLRRSQYSVEPDFLGCADVVLLGR